MRDNEVRERFLMRPKRNKHNDIDTRILLKFLDEFYPNLSRKFELNIINIKYSNFLAHFQYAIAKKIDCVIEINEKESDIIETDNIMIDESLGQLLTYSYWYERQTNRKVRNRICLCERVNELTANTLILNKCKIYVYNRIDDNFSEYTELI
jgi:hypothetical protein